MDPLSTLERSITLRMGVPMRRIIALSFLLVSSNAYAFSGPVTAAEWYAVHELCRLGQMADGAELSKNDNDAACAERDKLQKELAANGYCWNNDEQEWAACAPKN